MVTPSSLSWNDGARVKTEPSFEKMHLLSVMGRAQAVMPRIWPSGSTIMLWLWRAKGSPGIVGKDQLISCPVLLLILWYCLCHQWTSASPRAASQFLPATKLWAGKAMLASETFGTALLHPLWLSPNGWKWIPYPHLCSHKGLWDTGNTRTNLRPFCGLWSKNSWEPLL